MLRLVCSYALLLALATYWAAPAHADNGKAAAKEKPAKAAKDDAAKDKPKKEAAAKKAAKDKAAEKKAVAKAPQRLPKHYGDVLSEDTDTQEKIAKLYADYNNKMSKLRDQLKTVASERDAALEALLTKAQREKLAELRAKASTKK